jgi:hypothetical protein
VVIHNLNVISTLSGPPEKQTPLIIYPDAVLALSLSFERL